MNPAKVGYTAEDIRLMLLEKIREGDQWFREQPPGRFRRGPDVVYPVGLPYDDWANHSGHGWYPESVIPEETRLTIRWEGNGPSRRLLNLRTGQRHPATPEGWIYPNIKAPCQCLRCTGRYW